MSGAGTTIGKVSVKVAPDTRDFRKELKDGLERAERGVKSTVKATINAEINDKELERSTRLAIQAINFKSRMRDAGMVLKIRAEIDAEDLDDRIREIVGLANQEISMEIDTDEAEASVDRLARAVTNDAQTMVDDIARATAKIDADLDRLATEKRNIAMKVLIEETALRQAMDDLDDFHGEYDKKNIDFVTDLAAVAYRWTQAQLTRLSRDRIVHLYPLVDNKAYRAAEAALAALSGGRLIESTLRNIIDLFKNLDKNLPLIGSIAAAVAGLSAWLLTAASNTFALSRGLAQMFGAGLVLPGLLTGIALGVGTMVTVLADFNNRLPEVSRGLTYLKGLMQDSFWSAALDPMRQMIDTLLPEFASGLVGTAGVMGIFFASVSKSATKHLSGELEPMFRDLQLSMLIASSGTDDWMRSIEVLGRTGSSYLPRFAQWWNDIGRSFRTWLDDAEKTGRLNEIVETGILRMREFGNVIRWTGSILASLGRAAEKAGGSTLATLGDQLERIAKFMKGESFQNGFVQILDAAHGAMDRIVKISGPAFIGFWHEFANTASTVLRFASDAIGELFRGIGEALNQPALTAGLEAFFAGIAEGVRGMAPMWADMGAAIGTVGELLGTMAANFGPLLGDLLGYVSRLAVEAGPELERIVVSLADLMGALLDVAGPVLSEVIELLVKMAVPLAENHALVIALVAAFAGIKVAAGWGAVTAFFTDFKGLVKGTVTQLASADAGFKKFALRIGAIAAAAAAASALGGFASDIGVTAKGVDQWAVALKGLATSGGPEAVERLNAAFTGASSGWEWLVKPLFSTTGEVKNLATDVHSLADAVGLVDMWAQSNPFEKLFSANDATGGFFGHSAALNQAKVSLEEFDGAMAAVVASGNQDQLAAAQQYLADQIKASGLSTTEVMAMLPEYSLQLENMKLEQEVAAEAVRQSDAAMLAYKGALETTYGTQFMMNDAINESSKAFIDFRQGIDDADLSLDGWITKLEEQAVAQSAWADNMIWLSQHASEGVVAEFTELGVEGAARLQQLREGGGAEIGRLEEIVKAKTGGARANAQGEFAKMESELIAELNKLPPATIRELAKLGLIMTDQGGDVVTGLATGIGDGQPEVEGAIGDVADSVPTIFGKKLEIHSPSRVMATMGGHVIDGLVQGLQNIGGIDGAMAAVARAIRIDNPGSALVTAGRQVIDGFVSGLQGAFGRVRATLAALTDMLPDWKGPAERDQVILREAGQLVIDGFIDGLRDRFGDVRDVLGDLTDEVEGTEIGGPQFDPTDLGRVSRAAGARYAGAASYESNKTFIYNAAPGSSLDSEEELFSALSRGRGVF